MNNIAKIYLLGFITALAGWILIFDKEETLPVATAAKPVFVLKKIRTVETNDLFNEDFYQFGAPNLSGVPFPPGANTLLLLNQSKGTAIVELLAPPQNAKGKVKHTPIEIPDAINLAFNTVAQGAKGFGLFRLFLFNPDLGELIAVKTTARNIMAPQTIKRFDAQGFYLVNANGMTIDPASGALYLLDTSGPKLVRIQPKSGEDFTNVEVVSTMLPDGLGQLRGIAFNPEDGHVYIMSNAQHKLYKFTPEGELVNNLDIPRNFFGNIQGMIFAASLDSTDHPSIFHLYLVTSGDQSYETSEWALPKPF